MIDTHGKLLPYALELEEAVLGALLVDKSAIGIVSNIGLTPKDFYKEAHENIYVAIRDLDIQGKPIELLTVANKLRELGLLENAGGAYYVTQLTMKVSSAVNIEYHARIIQQKRVQRDTITNATWLLREAYEDTCDIYQAISTHQSDLDKLVETDENIKEPQIISETLDEAIIKIDQKQLAGVTGIRTPLQELNNVTGGWQNSDLIILGARPSMGKTSFLLQTLIEATKQDLVVVFFSLEMSKLQIANRIFSLETGIPFLDIQKGNLSESQKRQIKAVKLTYSNKKLIIDDTAAISSYHVKNKLKRIKQKYGSLGMFGVDYMQLMGIEKDESKKGQNREQEISYNSRTLKSICKTFDIPGIALSQLSRAVENRSDKRPMLSDLRESGSIEQDADMVMFIYRDEYYGVTHDQNGNLTAGNAEVIVAKHRNGGLGTINCKFNGPKMKFYDEGQMPDFYYPENNKEGYTESEESPF